MNLLLWSLISVFSELAFVRLFSTTVGATAYYGNLFLIVAVFSIGAGFFARRLSRLVYLIPLFLFVSFNAALWLQGFNLVQVLPYEFQWSTIANTIPKEVDFDLQLGVVLLTVTMVPVLMIVGSRMGSIFAEREYTRNGYIIMAAGGLLGGLLFALQNQLAPQLVVLLLLWCVMLAVPVLRDGGGAFRGLLAGVPLVVLLLQGLFVSNISYWSPYQRIDLKWKDRRAVVLANGFYIQQLWAMSADEVPREIRDIHVFPLRNVQKSDRVLVLGAGTGTLDVREALWHGAGHVTAVEIDPVFVRLGRKLDPDKTYDRQNVRVVIDDARRFLSGNAEKYDVVYLSFLDSQTNASNHARFRLDSFLYTVEGLELAHDALDEDGVLLISFAAATRWIQLRIFNVLSEVAGQSVRAFRRSRGVQTYYFVSKGRPMKLQDERVVEVTDRYRREAGGPVLTDDWPFLYSARPVVPKEHLRFLAFLLFVLCTVFFAANQLRGPSDALSGGGSGFLPYLSYAFFSGAAFFFIEIRTISVMVPVVGSTYMGQSLVIMSIILVSLLGSLLAHRFPAMPKGLTWALLFVSVSISFFAEGWFHPINGVLVRSLLLLLLLLTVPLFLAGYLYLSYLREVDSRGVLRMQKWNMFGGAIGGAAECVVIVMGFRNSIWVAFGFYLVGLISILSLRLMGSEASSRTTPISS